MQCANVLTAVGSISQGNFSIKKIDSTNNNGQVFIKVYFLTNWYEVAIVEQKYDSATYKVGILCSSMCLWNQSVDYNIMCPMCPIVLSI